MSTAAKIAPQVIQHSTPVSTAILIVIIGACSGIAYSAATVTSRVNSNTITVAEHERRLETIEKILIKQSATNERLEILVQHILDEQNKDKQK